MKASVFNFINPSLKSAYIKLKLLYQKRFACNSKNLNIIQSTQNVKVGKMSKVRNNTFLNSWKMKKSFFLSFLEVIGLSLRMKNVSFQQILHRITYTNKLAHYSHTNKCQTQLITYIQEHKHTQAYTHEYTNTHIFYCYKYIECHKIF